MAASHARFSVSTLTSEGEKHAAYIKTVVDDEISHYKQPGYAILVSRNGSPLYMGAFGLADVASDLPISSTMAFDLASCSKHITGLAVMKLVEQGRLHLDAPLRSVVHDFAVPVVGRPVTIADLLHHISGLADYTDDKEFAKNNKGGLDFKLLDDESHLQWLNNTHPHHAPGKRYSYNNSEFVLLSLVVARVSGMRFSDFARSQLLAPAGVGHVYIRDGSAPRPPPPAAVSPYSVESEDEAATPTDAPTIITGDGNVFMSLRDFAAWEAALRDGRVVSLASLRAAWSNGKLDSGEDVDDDGSGYGAGFCVDYPDAGSVSHTGSWTGTSTAFIFTDTTRLTVAVFSNDGACDVMDMATAIKRRFEGENDDDE